jgi:hypothetical protein
LSVQFCFSIENVVLRTLVGDPTRHKTSLQHPPPTTPTIQQATPASMYTLETRYRPIPPKVLPKQTGTTLYYIESQKAEENSAPNPPITREGKSLFLSTSTEKIICCANIRTRSNSGC